MTVVDRGIYVGLGERQTTMFEDVGAFHEKFDLPRTGAAPLALFDNREALAFRVLFCLEETLELLKPHCKRSFRGQLDAQIDAIMGSVRRVVETLPMNQAATLDDMADAMDAMCDLAYVALGTTHMMGMPFDAGWREVQRANMGKVRASGADDPRGKRGSALDVVKPEGWKPPNHRPAILLAMLDRENASPTAPLPPPRYPGVPASYEEFFAAGWRSAGVLGEGRLTRFYHVTRESCHADVYHSDGSVRLLDAESLTDQTGKGILWLKTVVEGWK